MRVDMAKKIIIGVHGIGDQVRYATTQMIAYQFCRHFNFPAAVPLGGFYHPTNERRDGIFELSGDNGEQFYFAEAYWADIARKPEVEGYTLEDAKAWAKTVAEKLRARSRSPQSKVSVRSMFLGGGKVETVALRLADGKDINVNIDYRMVRSVLYEAIDTVDVMEKLTFLARRAGFMDFNLKQVLTDFLGDVQIVAEFEKLRDEILEVFLATIEKAHSYAADENAEIIIVAHSEGSVIAFLGLLEAIKRNAPWINNVKGFVTLGSPIDKHLVLWPELWKGYRNMAVNDASSRIQWINYYDKGDPIGYELDSARDWVARNCKAFKFERETDIGFVRYFLPGAAHNEYWHDDLLFDHFIARMVQDDRQHDYAKKMSNNCLALISSNLLPYVALYTLLMLSVYAIYKPVFNQLHPGSSGDVLTFMRNIAGFAAIFAGITLAARIPRLIRGTFWLLLAVILFFAFIGTSYCLLDNDTIQALKNVLCMPYYVAAAAIGLISGFLGYFLSGARAKALVGSGAVVVGFIVYNLVDPNKSLQSDMWPVLTGGVLFLYLWWLSILLFDLVFIWHKYIRSSSVTRHMHGLYKSKNGHTPLS